MYSNYPHGHTYSDCHTPEPSFYINSPYEQNSPDYADFRSSGVHDLNQAPFEYYPLNDYGAVSNIGRYPTPPQSDYLTTHDFSTRIPTIPEMDYSYGQHEVEYSSNAYTPPPQETYSTHDTYHHAPSSTSHYHASSSSSSSSSSQHYRSHEPQLSYTSTHLKPIEAHHNPQQYSSTSRQHFCEFPNCGKSFQSRNHLTKHMASHDEKQSCQDCGTRLSRPDSAIRHLVQKHGYAKGDATEIARRMWRRTGME
ncbi:hypothetical protein BZA77DRAFT_301455 [Pyronema omphalodes]|nr:hypothetical protein BZA77DRAFT_301455 [Pyronema omphalodes]